MRGMKNVLVMFVLGWMTSVSFAQTTTNQTNQTSTEETFTSWQHEEDNSYMRSRDFIRQVGITQMACGSVMLPSGLAMIGIGTYKVNHPDINMTPEGDLVENQANRRGGMIMIATGTLTGVAGAILIMRGTDTLKKIRNKGGEVISELTLPKSGTGLAVRF